MKLIDLSCQIKTKFEAVSGSGSGEDSWELVGTGEKASHLSSVVFVLKLGYPAVRGSGTYGDQVFHVD